MIGPFPTAQFWNLGVVGGVAILMWTGIFIEHVQALEPCPLCLMQRIWFMAVGAIGCAALAHGSQRATYPCLAIVAALIGGGFSIRQLWLQSLPADQVPACGPGLEYMLEVFPLSEILIAMTSGTGDCAEVVWSMLGLSIPAWALVGFTGLIVVSALQLRAGRAR
jgi:disulfide bond formation protein DsbB